MNQTTFASKLTRLPYSRYCPACSGWGGRAGYEVSMQSSGQQQRVAVARALANHPSIILADEPTTALDGYRGRQVMELFRDVARQHGTGIIVVTHDHRISDL